jgi:hypothetical protein
MDLLVPLVYNEMATGTDYLRNERRRHVQPTALVHEAYPGWLPRISLTGRAGRNSLDGRPPHAPGLADHARRQKSDKRETARR